MNFCGAVTSCGRGRLLLGCGVVLRRGGRAFCGVCLCIFFFSRRRLPSSWRMLPSAEERASAPGKRGEGRVVRDKRRDGRRVVRVSDDACTLRIARRRSVPYYSSACLSVCPQAPYGLACSSTVWPCAFRHPSAAASSNANTFPFHTHNYHNYQGVPRLAAHLVLGGGGGDEARRWVEVGTPSPRHWATRGSPYPVREASKVKKSVAVGET